MLYNVIMRNGFLPPVQEKVLVELLKEKEKQWFVNELIRKTKEYPNAIHYALVSLEKKGCLKSEMVNNRRFYSLNYSNPLLENIEDILVKKGALKDSVHKEELVSPWIKLLNREASLAFQFEVPIVNRDVLPKIIHHSIGNFWYNGITYGAYYKKNDLKLLADAIEAKIRADKNFVKKNIKGCYELGKKLIRKSQIATNQNLSKMNNKKLFILFTRFRTSYQTFMQYLMYPHLIERYFVEVIKKELLFILQKQYKETLLSEVLNTLTNPVYHEIDEQVEMLQVAREIQIHGLTKKTNELIKALHQKYLWQPFFTVNARPLSYNYYRDAIKVLSKSKIPLQQEIKKIKEEQDQRKIELQKTLKKIKASAHLKNFVEILQSYMYLRTYRKNIISKAHFQHLPLIKEIARRMNAKDNFGLISYQEMSDFLTKGKKLPKHIMNKRKQGWAVIAESGFVEVISGKEEVLEVMERFQIGMLPVAPHSHTVIKGSPACQGNVIGTVRIVKDKSEFAKIKQGDILVTQMTTPDFVPLLNKIIGIITDEGGVTCHAAIISREYGLPCVVGTGNATKVIQDGDQVELNAYTGVIKIYEHQIKNEKDNLIKGKSLYKGKVSGLVVQIQSDEDLKRVTVDSIIVSNSITPQFLSALYKAKGFIVDEYSLTSHAYLYANTLQIPAIGGTKNASKVLETGDKVLLDATKGLVQIKP